MYHLVNYDNFLCLFSDSVIMYVLDRICNPRNKAEKPPKPHKEIDISNFVKTTGANPPAIYFKDTKNATPPMAIQQTCFVFEN